MLVGRESERRAISTLLAGARVGDSRVLVLSGEPGIGKTALLADAAAYVEDMRVLRAQGVESEQYVPFAGLLQLVRPLLPVLEHVPAPQASALSAALLLEESGDDRPSRFAVGAATLSLLARAAEDTPLAVLVDDAHLLDSPSAEALVFAARRLVSDAVAMLVTVRPDEPGTGTWARLPTLRLAGLDLAAAQRLVSRTTAVRPDQLRRLHRATAGNPLGLLELSDRLEGIEALPDGAPLAVPEQVSRSFLGRARDLGEEARLALLVAAAESASADAVRAACVRLGVGERGLAEAEAAGLVRVTGERVEFRHPLVRSAVYGAADPDTRRAVHRVLADTVPGDETARLAWHLSRSAVAPDEDTARTLDRVAAEASRRGAHAIASAAHERAAELAADSGLVAGRLTAAGEAAWLAGLTRRSTRLLDRALAARPQPLLRAHVHELRAAVETWCGSLETALSILTDAAQEVESTSPDAAVRMLADLVQVSFYLGNPAAAMRACAAIEHQLERCTEPDARTLGAVAAGMAMVLHGDGARGIERLRSPAYQLLTADDRPNDAFRLPFRALGALWLRDSGPHREMVNRAVERFREQAVLASLPYLLMHTARDAATSDRWDDAESAYTESVRLATETGQTTGLAVALAGLSELEARRGQEAQCRQHVDEADELSRRHQVRLASFWATFARGDLGVALGRLEDAAGSYESLLSALADRGVADPDQSCAPELVETYVHLGRRQDARRVAGGFHDLATAKGQSWSLARAERALGLCESGERAREHFAAAVRLHAQTPDRYETARTELAWGERLRRERSRVEARPLLRSALATFEMLGARPWADNAAQELQASGETARRREVTAKEQLTPQERQIARLLAEGRTTREAAAALFLSPKTVEYHLRHVYLKLGIRSRAELAAAFAG